MAYEELYSSNRNIELFSATLQGQQSALGSRLESLTEAAENGMLREREAEERLDAALSQHAHQISLRQVSNSLDFGTEV